MKATRNARVVVATLDDIRKGIAAAPHCEAIIPRPCSICQAIAVLPLDPETRYNQPDETTHVCHPVLGGCNHGFTIYDQTGQGFNPSQSSQAPYIYRVYTYDGRGVKIVYPDQFMTEGDAAKAADKFYRQGRNGGYLHFVTTVA